jgi:hypothetical protein
MVLSTAAKAAQAAARRAAATVKTGPRGGQTRSDRLVAKSSVRRQRIINKQLKSDQRASLAGQRRDTRGGGPNWRTGSGDKGYKDNILKRGMGLTRAEGLREAKKAAAIEKARRAKADGRMYFGLGAAGVAGTGFFGQQAHAAGPTHMEQKRGTNPDGTDAGVSETIKRSKTGYNVFGHGEFMNMDADDLSTYGGITGRRLTSQIKTKPKNKDILSNLPAGTMLTGYTKNHLDQSRLTTPDGKDAGVFETVVRTKTGRKVFGPYGYINIK